MIFVLLIAPCCHGTIDISNLIGLIYTEKWANNFQAYHLNSTTVESMACGALKWKNIVRISCNSSTSGNTIINETRNAVTAVRYFQNSNAIIF